MYKYMHVSTTTLNTAVHILYECTRITAGISLIGVIIYYTYRYYMRMYFTD